MHTQRVERLNTDLQAHVYMLMYSWLPYTWDVRSISACSCGVIMLRPMRQYPFQATVSVPSGTAPAPARRAEAPAGRCEPPQQQQTGRHAAQRHAGSAQLPAAPAAGQLGLAPLAAGGRL